MNIELPFSLHEKQREIFDSPAGNVVVKAGKRFGKSKIAVFKMVTEAGKRPGGMFWFISPTYRQSKNIAWREFKSLIPAKYIKRMVENELTIELVNNAVIQLIGADNEDSLRGPKIHGVVFDEAAYINKYVWNNIIRGQLLGSNGEKSGFAWFISSPNFKGTNWYSDFYLEAKRKQALGDENWAAFHYTIYDNSTLTKEQIDQIKDDSTSDEWDVEYLANESAHAGQIYSEFNYAKHVREEGLKSVGLFVRALDWGIAHPTVCLFAQVDVQGQRIHIEDEYVQSGYTIEESCEVIKRKTMDRTVDWTVCDPSLNKRNSQTKRTDKQEFDRLGVYCIAGDNNNRGYNITKMFFKKDIITIHPKCKTLIKQLKELQWGEDVQDDCCDCSRYLCVRLHDLVWNGLFNKEKIVTNLKATTFNLNDVHLFSKREGEGSSYKEQVAAY